MAGSKSRSKGSLPNLTCSSTHADTAPGTVTEFHPRAGTALLPNNSGVHPAGERPDAFKPCSSRPSQTMANASDPMPLDTGSTTVSAIAAAVGEHSKARLGRERLGCAHNVGCQHRFSRPRVRQRPIEWLHGSVVRSE